MLNSIRKNFGTVTTKIIICRFFSLKLFSLRIPWQWKQTWSRIWTPRPWGFPASRVETMHCTNKIQYTTLEGRNTWSRRSFLENRRFQAYREIKKVEEKEIDFKQQKERINTQSTKDYFCSFISFWFFHFFFYLDINHNNVKLLCYEGKILFEINIDCHTGHSLVERKNISEDFFFKHLNI